MNWQQIIKLILVDAKELGLCVEIDLVLGGSPGEIAEIKIRTQVKAA